MAQDRDGRPNANSETKACSRESVYARRHSQCCAGVHALVVAMGCSASRLPSERSISRPRAPKKPSRLASGSSGGSDDSGGDGGSAPGGAPAAEPGIQEGALGSPATLQSIENRPAPGSLPAASAAGAKSATSGKRRVSFVDEGNEPTPIALESSAAHAPPPMPPPPPAPQLVGKLAQYELLERIGDGAYAEVRRARNPAFESNGLPEYLAVKVIDVTKVEGGIRAIENEVMAASSPSVTMPSLHDATLHPP